MDKQDDQIGMYKLKDAEVDTHLCAGLLILTGIDG